VLQAYVDKLWLYSRLENKKLKLNKQDILLKDFLLQNQWLQGKSEFRLELSFPIELNLHADASLLASALHMLFENALQAGDGGIIRLKIESTENEILIRIEDEGRGIPPEAQAQIFDAFFQVNQVNTGLGLGLTLARAIFHLHGGSLRLDSNFEDGAAFVMTLPKH
jgi:two-component system sensor histidine kinase RstB